MTTRSEVTQNHHVSGELCFSCSKDPVMEVCTVTWKKKPCKETFQILKLKIQFRLLHLLYQIVQKNILFVLSIAAKDLLQL